MFAGIFDFILAAMVFAVMLYHFFGEYQVVRNAAGDQLGVHYVLTDGGSLALVVLIVVYFIVLGRTGGTVFQRLFCMKRAR
jgi:hypothetical protein